AGLASDIELIDDYPSHFSSYNRRKHRWVRGDWQILRWLLGRVPDYSGRLIRNPISLLSQWKILDNLRRSLFEPSLLLLFLGSWLYLPESPIYWTLAAVAVLFLPAYSRLLLALFRVPFDRRQFGGWLRDTVTSFLKENAVAVFALIFLLHQAMILADAIVRSLARVFVTRRKLLEWETAAEAEGQMRPKATVDLYLEWTPAIALLIGFAVWAIRPVALPAAAPILFLWMISRGVSTWLNRKPRTASCSLKEKDSVFLRSAAERIYRYFRDWSSESTAWLIPDSVREDGTVDLRLSPTNLGLLLNARVAAVHLGMAPLAEFVYETRQTLDRVLALPKYRGHLFNWYAIPSLAPIEPLFVSTVDSGNLAASLWALKQAALAFAKEPPAKRGVTKELAEELKIIAETSDRLVREMDFRCLYNRPRRALSIGIDAATGRPAEACYDMLATEARIAAFVAIAKGDAPQEVWFNLARMHTSFKGDRILLSWTGTMFEYLMPALWMRHYPGTMTEQSAQGVVRAQREYARQKGTPWGISESACLGSTEGDHGYMAFGISALAMRRSPDRLVLAPYATFLALPIDAAPTIDNLRRMEEFGWTGRYGFYEAIEYTKTGAETIRSWMAHHQGMSLLAVVNLLANFPLQQYFHAEPQVMATELLLHERAPTAPVSEPGIAIPEPAMAEA
ncbi:MAG: carbohydrate-binding protein, partial [Acidobacteriia bacterium]|nr:carbohydrate-binding protein [Terriglobia bacterium]